MREKDLKEDLATMAYKAEADHEVQMVKADLYKIAKYSIKLHEMFKMVSEEQGVEGWVQSKITKAADYMGSVYHHLDYEMKFDEMLENKTPVEMGEAKKKMVKDPKTGKMVPSYAIDGKGKDDLTKEELNSDDKPAVKDVVKSLKGASKAHANQAKELDKALKDKVKKEDVDLYIKKLHANGYCVDEITEILECMTEADDLTMGGMLDDQGRYNPHWNRKNPMGQIEKPKKKTAKGQKKGTSVAVKKPNEAKQHLDTVIIELHKKDYTLDQITEIVALAPMIGKSVVAPLAVKGAVGGAKLAGKGIAKVAKIVTGKGKKTPTPKPESIDTIYTNRLSEQLDEKKKQKGLYHNVNKRKKAGTSRSKNHPDAPSEKDWKNAAKTAKESVEGVCTECGNPSYTTLDEKKQKGVDGKVCWKGYKRMGTKKKGGKTVDNCVKM